MQRGHGPVGKSRVVSKRAVDPDPVGVANGDAGPIKDSQRILQQRAQLARSAVLLDGDCP